MVHSLNKNNNTYIGHVQGSEDGVEYKVTIKVDDDNYIEEMNCTCPYEENCKHECATIIYIRNELEKSYKY